MSSRTEPGLSRAALAWAAAALWLVSGGRSWCTETTDNLRNSRPCATGAYRQFGFWIGDWDAVDPERPSVVVAHARVELILNGCVLHEIYEAVDGHKGESYTIYDVTRDTWHQTWVNDHGYLLTIEGHLRGQTMVLEGTDRLPDGKIRQVRGEWTPDSLGVVEVATRSDDAGATWAPWFALLFKPHVGR